MKKIKALSPSCDIQSVWEADPSLLEILTDLQQRFWEICTTCGFFFWCEEKVKHHQTADSRGINWISRVLSELAGGKSEMVYLNFHVVYKMHKCKKTIFQQSLYKCSLSYSGFFHPWSGKPFINAPRRNHRELWPPSFLEFGGRVHFGDTVLVVTTSTFKDRIYNRSTSSKYCSKPGLQSSFDQIWSTWLMYTISYMAVTKIGEGECSECFFQLFSAFGCWRFSKGNLQLNQYFLNVL